MTNMLKRGAVCGGIIMLFFASTVVQASITTITLDVDPSTPTSGNWSTGDLVEIIIRASSSGDPGQGFSGADFLTDFRGIFVDTGKVKIHDILYFLGETGIQVDTEENADLYNGYGGYSMAGDTWVYDDFPDFTGDVIMEAGSFEAIVMSSGDDLDLGIDGQPVNFLHVVFEIQSGFDVGESTDVTYTGQLGAYGQEIGDEVWSDIFGEFTQSDDATGSFSLTLTPEPTTALLLLVGMAATVVRRKR